MSSPDPKRVAEAHLLKRVAGEVIFKKDRGGDVSQWAYADHHPSKRDIPGDFNYSPSHQKPLAKVLRSTLAALGHVLSAHNSFAKVKSARVSPDGSLGGRGYIMKIHDMRKQYMNCVEALSALSDTLYDEVNAPHWSLLSRQEDTVDKDTVSALIQDSEKIREDPQEWAEDQIEDEFEDDEDESNEEFDLEDAAGQELDIVDDSEDGWTVDEDVDEENPLLLGVMGKTASARDVRLALLPQRVALDWIVAHENQIPGGVSDKRLPTDFDHLVEDNHYDKLETIEGEHT